MASVASSRQTVLRRLSVPQALWARTVTSASDCRLSGGSVAATSSPATALTSGWSKGGNTGGDAHVPTHRAGRSPLEPIAVSKGGPRRGAPPLPGRLHRREARLRVSQEHQARALAQLILACAPCDALLARDHRCGGEIGAIGWERSRPETHSLPQGIFGSLHFPYSLPPSLRSLTLALFMKRCTEPAARPGWLPADSHGQPGHQPGDGGPRDPSRSGGESLDTANAAARRWGLRHYRLPPVPHRAELLLSCRPLQRVVRP
jgi:hypothetical protein